MMIEHERSYHFTHESSKIFLKNNNIKEYSLVSIEDYYLCSGLRVRKTSNENDIVWVLTQKIGEKSKGYRQEFEESISPSIANALISNSKMSVKKKRVKLTSSDEIYSVTMDYITSPIKLAIMEIEALNEIVYPIPYDITKRLMNVELLECPLSTYDLFKRHIGIFGTSSSGKTEISKILSHILNTKYNANSFHVVEFATTFIQKYKKIPNFWEEFFIWHGQHERELNAASADIIISDCPTFLTYLYSLHLPKEKFSSDTALVLSKMYKRVLFDIKLYTDLIFLKLLNYKENNIRYQTDEEALKIEERIVGFLNDHNISYKAYDYTKQDDILKDLFYLNFT